MNIIYPTGGVGKVRLLGLSDVHSLIGDRRDIREVFRAIPGLDAFADIALLERLNGLLARGRSDKETQQEEPSLPRC